MLWKSISLNKLDAPNAKPRCLRISTMEVVSVRSSLTLANNGGGAPQPGRDVGIMGNTIQSLP